MRIYIESTIPSYVVSRPARDLWQAARQQMTQVWWELRRARHALYSSQLVLDEIGSGDQELARRRLGLMQDIQLLDPNGESRSLTRAILSSGILPAKAERDAAHIAIATVYRMDILLTWNCRHIANAEIQSRLRKAAQDVGFSLPVLCTPEAEIGEDDE